MHRSDRSNQGESRTYANDSPLNSLLPVEKFVVTFYLKIICLVKPSYGRIFFGNFDRMNKWSYCHGEKAQMNGDHLGNKINNQA